jgi:hypothetical protein
MRIRIYLGSDRDEDSANGTRAVVINMLATTCIPHTYQCLSVLWLDDADCGEKHWVYVYVSIWSWRSMRQVLNEYV